MNMLNRKKERDPRKELHRKQGGGGVFRISTTIQISLYEDIKESGLRVGWNDLIALGWETIKNNPKLMQRAELQDLKNDLSAVRGMLSYFKELGEKRK